MFVDKKKIKAEGNRLEAEADSFFNSAAEGADADPVGREDGALSQNRPAENTMKTANTMSNASSMSEASGSIDTTSNAVNGGFLDNGGSKKKKDHTALWIVLCIFLCSAIFGGFVFYVCTNAEKQEVSKHEGLLESKQDGIEELLSKWQYDIFKNINFKKQIRKLIYKNGKPDGQEKTAEVELAEEDYVEEDFSDETYDQEENWSDDEYMDEEEWSEEPLEEAQIVEDEEEDEEAMSEDDDASEEDAWSDGEMPEDEDMSSDEETNEDTADDTSVDMEERELAAAEEDDTEYVTNNTTSNLASGENGYKLHDETRKDLTYQVRFETYKYETDLKNLSIQIQYPIVSGDFVPNLDTINNNIQYEISYLVDGYEKGFKKYLTDEGYYKCFAEAYVTYMDEESMSVVYSEYIEADFYNYYELYSMNFDMKNGFMKESATLVNADESTAQMFRSKSSSQNGYVAYLNDLSDKDLLKKLKNNDDLIYFRTPSGYELGINYEEGWTTISLPLDWNTKENQKQVPSILP